MLVSERAKNQEKLFFSWVAKVRQKQTERSES